MNFSRDTTDFSTQEHRKLTSCSLQWFVKLVLLTEVKEMSTIIRETMIGVESSNHHKFTVPLSIDLNSGENWGMLH